MDGVAHGVPVLWGSSPGVPSLADPSAEASDGRTLRFLLTKALALQKEEDEERSRRSSTLCTQ